MAEVILELAMKPSSTWHCETCDRYLSGVAQLHPDKWAVNQYHRDVEGCNGSMVLVSSSVTTQFLGSANRPAAGYIGDPPYFP